MSEGSDKLPEPDHIALNSDVKGQKLSSLYDGNYSKKQDSNRMNSKDHRKSVHVSSLAK